MTPATLPRRLVEFFTLSEATRESADMPEETRSLVLRGLRMAFQKREAAETLWPRGATAEGLRLAVAALEGAVTALAAFPTDPPIAWVVRAQAIAAEATARTAGIQLPTLETETKPEHEEAFPALLDALIAIEELAAARLVAPTDLRRIRNVRILSVTIGVVVALAILIRVLEPPTVPAKATASAQYGPGNGPEKAFDGNVTTPWALPEHVSQGWIDFELERARKVRTLHILASNPPDNTRGIKDARIDAMLGPQIVKSLDFSFPDPTGNAPNWNDVVLDAPKCDHVRITVRSVYKQGAAIGEIEIK